MSSAITNNKAPTYLERLAREEVAGREGVKHEHRMLAIGVCAILIGFASSRYAARRRAAIMRGDRAADEVNRILKERMANGGWT